MMALAKRKRVSTVLVKEVNKLNMNLKEKSLMISETINRLRLRKEKTIMIDKKNGKIKGLLTSQKISRKLITKAKIEKDYGESNGIKIKMLLRNGLGKKVKIL